MFLVLINVIVLAMHNSETPDELLEFESYFNYVLVVWLIIELLLRLFGLGPRIWAYDKLNIFDAVLVILGIIDIILHLAEDSK